MIQEYMFEAISIGICKYKDHKCENHIPAKYSGLNNRLPAMLAPYSTPYKTPYRKLLPPVHIKANTFR